jgi:glutaredoxin
MFEIFSKPDCSYCDRAKVLLQMNGYDYTEKVVGVNILREDFLAEFPDQRTVPLIFDGETKVGGYTELVEYLKSKGPEQELLHG